MQSFNEQISDDFIKQAVEIERLKASLRSQTNDALDKLEKILVSVVVELDPTKRQSTSLFEKLPEVIDEHYVEERKKYEEMLLLFLLFLKNRPKDIFEKRLGFSILSNTLTSNEVKNLAKSLLVEGATIREWWERQPVLTNQRVKDTVRKAVSNKVDLPALIAEIRGTKENNFKDGILTATRREAESVVVTSLQKGSVDVLLQTYLENIDVISKIQQKSTLDARTTDICKAYSGLAWSLPDLSPLGHSLPFNGGPPRHWRCRSIIVPITKSFSELSGKKFRQISSGTQASMDGQVSRDLNYEDWLRTKSESFQRKILGEKKFDLWKKNKISFKDLVDQSGNSLTIEELVKKYN